MDHPYEFRHTYDYERLNGCEKGDYYALRDASADPLLTLAFYPKGRLLGDARYTAIEFKWMAKAVVKGFIELTDEDGDEIVYRRFVFSFRRHNHCGRDRLIESSKVLPNRKVHLHCRLQVIPDSPSLVSDHRIEMRQVRLVANGKGFFVHEIVLWSESEKFAALLDHDRTISNFTTDAVKVALDYMYGGMLRNRMTWGLALELIVLARTYDMHRLKEDCTHYYLVEASGDAYTLLNCAHHFDDETLIKSIVKCMRCNGIPLPEESKEFLTHRSKLSVDLIEMLLSM